MMLKGFFDNSYMFIAQDVDGKDIELPGPPMQPLNDPDTDGSGILPIPG
jgi:hypothetical protein